MDPMYEAQRPPIAVPHAQAMRGALARTSAFTTDSRLSRPVAADPPLARGLDLDR
jgi:hypothetical protein